MSVQVKIELTEEAKSTMAAVQQLPSALLLGIARAMDKENGLTVAHIMQDYLSFPPQGPPSPIGLRVQTNRLRGSVRASKSVIVGQMVESAIASNVKYAAVHEFGFQGTEQVRAFTRHGKSGEIAVRAHTRRVNIGARAPFQRGIADRADNYASSISRQIVDYWNQK